MGWRKAIRKPILDETTHEVAGLMLGVASIGLLATGILLPVAAVTFVAALRAAKARDYRFCVWVAGAVAGVCVLGIGHAVVSWAEGYRDLHVGVAVPGLMVGVPAGLALVFLLSAPGHGAFRRKAHKTCCANCGYDLFGQKERCAECGTPFDGEVAWTLRRREQVSREEADAPPLPTSEAGDPENASPRSH